MTNLNFDNLKNITGVITKRLDSAEAEAAVGANADGFVELPFRLELVNDNTLRFLVDESGRKIVDRDLENVLSSERFSPEQYVLDYDLIEKWRPTREPEMAASETGFRMLYGKTLNSRVDVEYSPPKLTFTHNGEEVLRINDDYLFNLEHLRKKQASDPMSWWTDRFDKHTDRRVRGPESVALDTKFMNFAHVFGIPEHADSFVLRKTDFTGDVHEPYRLFNVDIFQYDTNSVMPMYGSIPFMLAQRPGAAAGVFWLNSADTYVDIGQQHTRNTRAHWISETGKMDVFVFVGDSMKDLLSSYGYVTGTSAMPQMFALGYHQCRWNYRTQEELLEVDKKMDEHNVPYDVIWLDIEWTEKRKYFEWNLENYPDPELMMKKLEAKNRQLVVLNDPHIRVEPGYEPYDEIVNGPAILDNRGKKAFVGHCWPGQSIWIDGLNPEAVDKWTKLCAKGTPIGLDANNLHLWSDMSEPSVFSGSETTAYKDLVHYGGFQHRDVHNVYGHTVFDLTTEALKRRYEGKKRPFVLTRSFFAGSQRFGPAWTGDNQAEWPYLQSATSTILSLGVAGMPFVGADVGGFFKNPDLELQIRWYQAGCYYPFFRAHAHEDSDYREPYLLDSPFFDAVQRAIQLRYQLMPEYYTLFHEASIELKPILRPLLYEFPDSPEIYTTEDEFMIGSSLLAMPVVTKNAHNVLLFVPDDELYWYDYSVGQIIPGSPLQINVGMDTMPLFVRGGSVVFTKQRMRRNTKAMARDPYTVIVAFDKDGHAKGHVYVDDGETYAYENGDYIDFEIELTEEGLIGRALHTAPGYEHLYIEKVKFYGGDVVETPYARMETEALEESFLMRTQPQDYGYSFENAHLPISSDWFIRIY